MRTTRLALRCTVPSKRKFVPRHWDVEDSVPTATSSQSFHSFPKLKNTENNPTKPTESDFKLVSDELSIDADNRTFFAFGGPYNEPDSGPDAGGEPSKPKDPNKYGSAARRARRNRLPKELPVPYIPGWFLDKNVELYNEANDTKTLISTSVASQTADEAVVKGVESLSDEVQGAEDHEGAPERHQVASNEQAGSVLDPFNNSNSVNLEVDTMIRAGLRLPQNLSTEPAASKPHLLLVCPESGASQHLHTLVSEICSGPMVESDIIRIGAQDIAEIAGGYIDEPGRLRPNTFSSLSYDIWPESFETPSQPYEEPLEEDEGLEDDGQGPPNSIGASPRRHSQFSSKRGVVSVGMGVIPLGSIVSNAQDIFKALGNSGGPVSAKIMGSKFPRDSVDDSTDTKLGLLMETLLNARETKRSNHSVTSAWHDSTTAQPSEAAETPGPQTNGNSNFQPEPISCISKNLVVLVEDYPQIDSTICGNKFLDRLHSTVNAKRKDGYGILIVGTSSTTEFLAPRTKEGIRQAQTVQSFGPVRTIIVPVRDELPIQTLAEEHKRKIKAINLRHLRMMVRRLAPIPHQVRSLVDDWDFELDRQISFLVDIDEHIMSMDFIDRLTTAALGLKSPWDYLNASHIAAAIHLICDSDDQKTALVTKVKDKVPGIPSRLEQIAASEDRIQKLRQKCNRHEKKLLAGVIDAASIKTTFADIRVPPDTVEALKTLTSLSLIRPDAFTYGILANNRIPGLLLYGPPGTGKTLLAKAVARESGATVLEISGSDVYDMYVGEGEKNVKAIFSLAKKLTPCVVFIDEGDAILGSRGGSSNRNSHRELINQFLREWDGLTDTNAFIMVATNRPFDLDEASLRRLPRRLLVDLPVEKDREEILRIHLKGETLNADVSLSELASDTPYYSGSDLKNLCVAAALACVREEVDTAMGHQAAGPADAKEATKLSDTERRVLSEKHFKKAMEEISASISEDMRSLSAIRKFDEKYGDRKGRRKKLGSYGFRTTNEEEKKGSDAARVRTQ